MKTKLFRITTIPLSLNILLKGQLSFLNQYYDVTGISGYDENLKEVKDREKIKIHRVDFKRAISPLHDFVSLFTLYFYFKKERPTIVHSITPKAGLISMIAAKLAGVPIRMHTFTGLVFPTRTGWMKKLLIQMDKLLCYCATNIYPEGKGVQHDLINYKITKKPLKILANGNVNGIDLEYFNPSLYSEQNYKKLRDQLNILHDDFVFIFIGRMVKDKGINELVSAFQNLNKPKFKLLLVGPLEKEQDPLLPETVLLIENTYNIISVGFQRDVRPYLAISDVLVFPSYREGFPNVVMQAGAMELPSIVTDINGSNEIIINNENGIVVPVKNVLLLQNAMEKIYKDVNFRTKLKNNSRKMIAHRYQQNVVLEALLDEYQTLERNVQKRF